MAESTQVLMTLKRAANYSKLAFHKDGPRSFKRGQGALTKVLAKFGDNGALDSDELAGRLGWDAAQVSDVVAIAQENGYVLNETAEGQPGRVALTDKGREVVQKRLEAEDRTADEILQEFSDEEKDQLEALCTKIIDRCVAMGVDYSLIKKRHGKCCKGKGKGKSDQGDDKAKGKGAKKAAKASKKSGKKDKKAAKKHRHSHKK